MVNKILYLPEDELIEKGAHFTAKEIAQQPQLWQRTYALATKKTKIIDLFLNKTSSQSNLEIILTGAGTSAYIGDSLQGIFQNNTGIRTLAIATTDLVTHPQYYFHESKPILLISFARSGESPESLAAIQLGNQICRNINHLIITCNAKGTLVKVVDKSNSLVIILPSESNDQGLAMTSSFTSMLLMAILISKMPVIKSMRNDIAMLSQYGQKIIDIYSKELQKICELPFERAVFLGSGPLRGCAEECHLKLLELTDGSIITRFDSFLGFRHGPKAIINPKTLMVYFFSSDSYTVQYEIDLLKTINSGERGMYSLAILEKDQSEINVDLKIILSSNDNTIINSDFLPVCNTLLGQLLGFFKSLQLGLKPDKPSVSGTITRVVQGVKIYPYKTK